MLQPEYPAANQRQDTPSWRWDVFCRVIDNHGDLGVCWRLCADLAQRGQRIRLWCDDARALQWMAPEGHPGVEVLPWREPLMNEKPADVVVEAFGCDPPAGFVQRMAASATPPLWINLEYLSAERYVECSHGLPSPQLSGPGRGLTKWFYYPGFTPATGGLLREVGLLERQSHQDATRFMSDSLHRSGMSATQVETTLAPRAETRLVSVFSYTAQHADALWRTLPASPRTLLLVCPGPAQADWMNWAASAQIPGLDAINLPWLRQSEYDQLLWSCNLNLVRGEDSFVRAQWAARPFVWQIYPQDDGAHLVKLQAFVDLFARQATSSVAGVIRSAHAACNDPSEPVDLPTSNSQANWRAWQLHCELWRTGLLAQNDLCSQLLRFVTSKR